MLIDFDVEDTKSLTRYDVLCIKESFTPEEFAQKVKDGVIVLGGRNGGTSLPYVSALQIKSKINPEDLEYLEVNVDEAMNDVSGFSSIMDMFEDAKSQYDIMLELRAKYGKAVVIKEKSEELNAPINRVWEDIQLPSDIKNKVLTLVVNYQRLQKINQERKIENNVNQCLFAHTMTHTLLLDNNRGEKLFDLLPFNSIATDTILKNHEYE